MTDASKSKRFEITYIPSKFASGMFKLDRPIHNELVELILLQEMQKAALDPAIIYAYEKTLLWITEDNLKDRLGRSNFSKKQLDSWENAQVQFYKGRKAASDE